MIGGCLVSCQNANNESEPEFYLYCGLNDADTSTQVLTVEQAQAEARKVITDLGYGYTEYVTYGGYIDGSDVKENDTIVYMLIFMERADAENIAKKLKQELNLASVMIKETTANFGFVE